MSVSVYAMAIIGVKLPHAPYEESKERCCSHEEGAQAFCGKCGAKMWENTLQPISICEINDDEDIEKMGDFSVLCGGACHPFSGQSDDFDYFVGLHPMETGNCMYGGEHVFADISDVDIPMLKSQLKELLEPHGLWSDDMQVGLHVFGYVS